jgi:hypothetical protein
MCILLFALESNNILILHANLRYLLKVSKII